MRPPTAGHLLRQIAARQQQADATRVADLGDPERAAVVAALQRVPARARVDVNILVATVTAEVRARTAAEAAERERTGALGALKYKLSIMPLAKLDALRADLKRRVEDGKGGEPFDFPEGLSPPSTDVRDPPRLLDLDLDDETGGDEPEAAPSPRRGVPRVPSRRSLPSAARSAPRAHPTAENRPNTPPGREPTPFFHGRGHGAGGEDRPWGCPAGSDFARWRNAGRLPAWIIESPDTAEGDTP